jgi:hypothetical protein
VSNSKSRARFSVYFVILACSGVIITLATGLVHGRITQRWGAAPDLQKVASQLKALPPDIGDWRLLDESTIEERVLQMLSCAGYINRQYVNRKSGQTVSIAIIVGPSGPTSVHTPEICYSSRAHSIETPRRQIRLSGADGTMHSFWSLTFRSQNPLSDELSVCYAWSAGDVWVASESPRFEYAAEPLLFKVQVAGSVSPRRATDAQDPCQEFLAAFLQLSWQIKKDTSENVSERNSKA